MRKLGDRSTCADLLRRLRDPSDEASWRRFDDFYGEFITRYCMRRGLSLMDAEDVRQIVCMTLVRTLPRFRYARERGRFRGYLATVIRRAIGQHASACNNREYVLSDHALQTTPDPNLSADTAWDEEWRRHHYRLAFNALRKSADAKNIEIYEDLARGMSVGTVASNRNISRDAVYKIKQRMRQRMKVKVSEQVAVEESLWYA